LAAQERLSGALATKTASVIECPSSGGEAAMKVVRYLIVAVLLLPSPLVELRAATTATETLRELLATPENEVDLAKAKLELDKLVDPSINIQASLGQIEEMARTVRGMTTPDAPPLRRLAAVRRFLYVPGEWNQFRPYSYDKADPFGTNIREKLLSNYLKTRVGNCVSMPILMIVLGQRLGLHMALSKAPLHYFARYVNDATGKTYNLEATSGGLPARDEWYRQNLPMSDEAIRNGVYLKTLSNREAVAMMAQIVLEEFLAEKRFHEVVASSDLILSEHPHDVPALLAKGGAYAGLIDSEFRAKYPAPVDIPPELQPVYRSYLQANHELFSQAESLGWRENDGVLPRASGELSAH
jgi:regulator of sirC expression with transglutaminase-like and TPR domain